MWIIFDIVQSDITYSKFKQWCYDLEREHFYPCDGLI